MKIVNLYIAKTVITYVALVMLFLFGLQIFIEFMHEFPSLGEGNYGIYKVATYVFLMLPYDIYQFFPMACLLGSVIGLGLLASHSELIVMRGSGMSLFDIASAVIKAALVLIVVMLLIGEVLSPLAHSKAARLKTKAVSSGKMVLTQHGVWLYNKGNFININSVSATGELRGITRYKVASDLKLKGVEKAASGKNKNGNWVFKNIAKTNFKANEVISDKVEKEIWPLEVNSKLIGATHIDSDQKSLFELRSYIKHRVKSGLDASKYEFAFWQRIFSPLATLVMILLALPFVFGQLRSSTMGFRMFIGVMLGFVFYVLNQFVGPMSIVYQIPPTLSAILPTLVFAFLGGVLLAKIR